MRKPGEPPKVLASELGRSLGPYGMLGSARHVLYGVGTSLSGTLISRGPRRILPRDVVLGFAKEPLGFCSRTTTNEMPFTANSSASGKPDLTKETSKRARTPVDRTSGRHSSLPHDSPSDSESGWLSTTRPADQYVAVVTAAEA